MKRRRVKITGIGPVTPAGIGRDEFWKGILEPVSRVKSYEKIGSEFGSFVAAEVSSHDLSICLGEAIDVPKGAARHTLLALAATILALADAQISILELRRKSCSIVTGSSLLDFGGVCRAIESVQKKGLRGVLPRVVYTVPATSVPDVINRVLRITSQTMNVQTSCCAGLDAIGHGAAMVADRRVDLAICGGTEGPLHRFPMLELREAGLTPMSAEMPGKIARPFDRWRTTGVVGEGACMFILEPEESKRLGYGFISGYAYASDDSGVICNGLEAAGRMALADARLRPSQVGAISAWGPGHKLIDTGEACAMSRLFGEALAEIPTVSIKGAVGAALGAAPAIQVAAAALGLSVGMLPPTVNWEYPDPACMLNLSRSPRRIQHENTVVNAHGVGGVNSCIVIEKC